MSDLPPVSAIADVLALRGLGGWLTPPLAPVVASSQPVAGRALTIALRADPAGRGLGELQQLLSQPLDGAVLVLAGHDGGGFAGVGGAVWGEILSRAARGQGAVGVLVDGAVRDAVAMAAEGLPVYAATQGVVGPAGRVSIAGIDVPVGIGGFRVDPGDMVVVDDGGAVRIPQRHSYEILADARSYAAAEDRVLEGLAAGMPLVEAYRAKQTAVDAMHRAQGAE